MPTETLLENNMLKEQNSLLAPIIAKWMHAYMECSNATQAVIMDMVRIINDPEADEDDIEMAKATFLEALFPATYNGMLGADLEELEALHCDNSKDFSETAAAMDQQEREFGARVHALLKENDMTQDQLAEKIGVNQSAISMLINRNARPQKRTVERIAAALGVSPGELWPA